MKKKKLVASLSSLAMLATTGSLVATACSSKDESKQEDLYITGRVTDYNGNKLKYVNVSSNNGVSVKTNEDGRYKMVLEKPSDVVYFEKEGYISEVFGSYDEQVHKTHTVDVKLYPYSMGKEIEVSGNVTDVTGAKLPKCSITYQPQSEIFKQHTLSDANGRYYLKLKVSPETQQVSYVVHAADLDKSEHVVNLIPGSTSQIVNIKTTPYQYDFTASVGTNGSDKIIMHAYRDYEKADKTGTLITFSSNFTSAFAENNDYKLTFNVNQTLSSPYKELEEGDKDFSFTFKKGDIIKEFRVTDTVNLTTEQKNAITFDNPNLWNLSVFLPETEFPFTDESGNDITFGIHLDSMGRGKFEPYAHQEFGTDSTNQLCYIRLDKYNKMYTASDNVNPFGLTWDTTSGGNWKVAGSGIAGQSQWEVEYMYNFGYQVRVAKYYEKGSHKNGIYIMTKYGQDQMAEFLPDLYRPHFFFDPVKLDSSGAFPTREFGSEVKHIAPCSGYWLEEYVVRDKDHPFAIKRNYDGFFDYTNNELDRSPKVYCEKGFMITYIPFSFLNHYDGEEIVQFDDTMGFGLACNLQYPYTGGEWHAWQGSNPSGYKNIPHFEEITSYIRFDKNLNVLPYKKA